MVFKVRVKEAGAPDSEAWWESYDQPEVHTDAQAQQYATDVVRHFNETQKSWEPTREIVRVWCFGDSEAHTWNKLSLSH